MERFLQHVAKRIFDMHGRDMSDTLVLFPNHRSLQYFLHELTLLKSEALIAPHVYTLDDFMLKFQPYTVADGMELLVAFATALKKTYGEEIMVDWLQHAHTLIDDFDEIDRQVENRKKFFNDLKNFKSITSLFSKDDNSEFASQYRLFWENIDKLYEAYQEELKTMGKGYNGMLLRYAAERADELAHNCDYIKQGYAVGFSGLYRCDEIFLNWLGQKFPLHFYIDADAWYCRDAGHEAGYFFRKYSSLYRVNVNELPEYLTEGEREIEIIGVPRLTPQAHVAADILCNRWNITNEALSETAVVVTDTRVLHSLLFALPENIEALNITMGMPASDTSAYGLWESLRSMLLHAYQFSESRGLSQLYHSDVLSLIQNKLLSSTFSPFKTDKLQAEIYKNNLAYISVPYIIGILGQETADVFTLPATAHEVPGYLLNIFRRVLQACLKDTQIARVQKAIEAEACMRIMVILEGAKKLTEHAPNISPAVLLNLLHKQIRQIHIPYAGEGFDGLQLMGLQETRALSFRNVIILTANEGTLPPGKHLTTHIPYRLRKEYLTTYQERNSIAAYLFYRLLHRAERVAILYNTEPDELGGGEKSRFVLQLEKELAPYLKKGSIRAYIHQPLITAAKTPTPIVIPKTSVALQKQIALLTGKGLSPSALNAYIQCTLRYYFRYIAGIGEQDEIEETPDAATIGEAVHYALEQIFLPYVGRVAPVSELHKHLNDKKQIEGWIYEKLKERFDEISLQSGKNYLIYRSCVKLVEEFLLKHFEVLETNEKSNKYLHVEALEQTLTAELPVGELVVKFNGRIDRIHRSAGDVYIADYKTGKHSTLLKITDDTFPDELDDPKNAKAVQLLLYAWLYRKQYPADNSDIVPGIYWLQQPDKELSTLQTGKSTGVVDDAMLQIFEKKIKQWVSAMLNPEIPYMQTDDEKRCKYCEFQQVCNRA
ncbi:MAG: PD-(D/E)XK nuclease family protein [Chitinophagales bacterium]|nr:PD-(D/E)XK nuclease family protein [Chitinophagales bacterium]MDW8418140.1 PD-(D/E)XK nuclease family protein [Chitinophagales bacterium]